jgi:hypothetical protein
LNGLRLHDAGIYAGLNRNVQANNYRNKPE